MLAKKIEKSEKEKGKNAKSNDSILICTIAASVPSLSPVNT